MFDPFGVDPTKVDECNKQHAINALTVMQALITKGLLTEEELDKARVQATQMIDRAWAKKRDEAEREFRKSAISTFFRGTTKDQTDEP